MFKVERIYCQTNTKTSLQEWFFSAREGELGPFSSKEKATKALLEYKKTNIESSNDGGRSSDSKIKLSLLPKDIYLVKAKPNKKA